MQTCLWCFVDEHTDAMGKGEGHPRGREPLVLRLRGGEGAEGGGPQKEQFGGDAGREGPELWQSSLPLPD